MTPLAAAARLTGETIHRLIVPVTLLTVRTAEDTEPFISQTVVLVA